MPVLAKNLPFWRVVGPVKYRAVWSIECYPVRAKDAPSAVRLAISNLTPREHGGFSRPDMQAIELDAVLCPPELPDALPPPETPGDDFVVSGTLAYRITVPIDTYAYGRDEAQVVKNMFVGRWPFVSGAEITCDGHDLAITPEEYPSPKKSK